MSCNSRRTQTGREYINKKQIVQQLNSICVNKLDVGELNISKNLILSGDNRRTVISTVGIGTDGFLVVGAIGDEEQIGGINHQTLDNYNEIKGNTKMDNIEISGDISLNNTHISSSHIETSTPIKANADIILGSTSKIKSDGTTDEGFSYDASNNSWSGNILEAKNQLILPVYNVDYLTGVDDETAYTTAKCWIGKSANKWYLHSQFNTGTITERMQTRIDDGNETNAYISLEQDIATNKTDISQNNAKHLVHTDNIINLTPTQMIDAHTDNASLSAIGKIKFDSSNLYICVDVSGNNAWKTVALSDI